MRTGLLAAMTLFIGGAAIVVAPTVATAASGQVCMGVVVDDGSGGAPTPQAAQVAPGTSDLQALGAAGDTATQNDAGLVCAINGYPANGLQNCTNVSGNLYYFWSYWQGDPYTNTWTYAPVGPASHAVSAGQTYVEGWRYENPGPDNATAPKPAIAPAAAFASACPGVTPVPLTANGGGGGGGTGSGSGSGGTGAPPGSVPAPGAVPTTTPAPGTATAPSSTGTGQGHNTAGADGGATTTSRPGPSAATGPAGSGSGKTGSTTTSPAAGPKAKGKPTAAALASSTPHGGSGGSPILPLVLVAAAIAAIGGLTLYRWRRRPAEE